MINFLFIIGISLFLNMTIGLLLSVYKKNMSVVDIFWATGIGLTSWVIYFMSPNSQLSLLIVCLISLWAIRLSLFLLLTRIINGEHDRRYQKIVTKWTSKKKMKTAGHFYMQAILQSLICCCFYPIFQGLPNSISGLTLLFSSLFICSFIGQFFADYQLNQFKKSNKNTINNSICEKGLWRICRHPNYFFEVVMWLCLFCMTIPYSGYKIALISPISIWIITRYITGPYTERLSIEKRGNAYKNYQKRVPMIIPSLRLVLRTLI